MSEILKEELETFHKALPSLLDRVGKYTLVKDRRIVSIWDTYKDAIQEGYKQFVLSSFLVKQIQPIEKIHRFTRNIEPACPSSTSNSTRKARN